MCKIFGCLCHSLKKKKKAPSLLTFYCGITHILTERYSNDLFDPEPLPLTLSCLLPPQVTGLPSVASPERHVGLQGARQEQAEGQVSPLHPSPRPPQQCPVDQNDRFSLLHHLTTTPKTSERHRTCFQGTHMGHKINNSSKIGSRSEITHHDEGVQAGGFALLEQSETTAE